MINEDMLKNIPQSRDIRRIPLEWPIIVAHQPQFLPWLGFFNKAAMGDVYLIHDVDQFKKETFENRNKIHMHNEPGWLWLTAPVKGKSKVLNIEEVTFNGEKWRKKVIKQITLSYHKSRYFTNYLQLIKEIINFPTNSLREFNINTIKKLFEVFEINIPVFRSSDLIKRGYVLEGVSTNAVISMCSWFGAKTFVAGLMGKTYLEVNKFKDAGIQLVFQKFEHPVYEQFHGEFMPYMSVIDLLFNQGPNSIEILGKSIYEF